MRAKRHLRAALLLLAAAIAGPSCQPIEPARTPLSQGAIAAGQPTEALAQKETTPSEPPIELRTPDGKALSLLRLKARATLQDPLALTELTLTFQNPEDRVVEGTFRVRLPEGAALAGFAMKVGDQWQQGAIVPRAEARTIFEDFLHRRQDPALIEGAQGNEFSVRIFPIPARGRKEISLSYSQELSAKETYHLPLEGLPKLDELDIAVELRGSDRPAITRFERDFLPNADFTVPSEEIPRSTGRREKNLAVVRVTPVAESRPEPLLPTLILIDTSASRALRLEADARLVGDLSRRIAVSAGAGAALSVAAFDQTVEPIFDGAAGSFGARDVEQITARGALGASDINAALSFAALRMKIRGLSRLILITDGLSTAGDASLSALRAAASKLADSGALRLDVISTGEVRSDDALRTLASAGLPRAGVVVDASEGLDKITRRLTEATSGRMSIAVVGAKFSWPKSVVGLQAGDEVRVFADIPEDAPLKISIDGAESSVVPLAPGERSLLARASTQARIASLLDTEARLGSTADTRRAIIALSTESRILSPYTSLLVLETQADFERYNLNRQNPSDPAPPATASGGATPSGGVGRSHGRIQTAHRVSRPPAIRMAATMVSGRVPPEAIRRIVRLNFPRLRACYEDGLRANPKLEGRVVVRFVINEEGNPEDTKSDGSTLPDPKVVQCVVDVFHSLGFPTLDGTRILVIYPLVFSPNTPGTPESEHQAAGAPPMPLPIYVRRQYIPEPAPPERRGERPFIDPYSGPFKQVMDALATRGREGEALSIAASWHKREPGETLALIALGEALEAKGDLAKAARAYGSLIDLFPGRADLRRFAGERLERIKDVAAQDLALDTFRRAAEDRPDHPSSHRLLAMALLKRGAFEEAFNVMTAALRRWYPETRFEGVRRIFREDLGLIAAAWRHAEPDRRDELFEKLLALGASIEEEPSLRFVLIWETDANDVDFHIRDAKGGHAYYGNRSLPSGGELYADITTGYGPECFTVRTRRENRPEGYKLEANYFSRGPMGYGMGKLQIIEHDGIGGLHFEERPFVAMNDGSSVNLGAYPGSGARAATP